MKSNLKSALLAGVLSAGVAISPVTSAFGQSASSVGLGGSSTGPSGTSATGGTAGSGAAGGTSTGPAGTSSTVGSGGSAAGGDKNTSSTKTGGNDNNLHSMSKARAPVSYTHLTLPTILRV